MDDLAAAGWRQACQAAAQGMFDALSRHRNVAPLLVEWLPVSLQDEFTFGLGLLVSGLDELRANQPS